MNEPVRFIRSQTVVIATDNVDTDQILPARFLTTTSKDGLGERLFADWRYLADGSPNPDFILNRPESAGCRILVAGRNFESGSSREHAPWALLDYGFRVVISTQIADIFRNNSLMNGLVSITIDPSTHEWLVTHPGAEVSVDLDSTVLKLPNGIAATFPLERFARHCLLNGMDELSYLRSKIDDIEEYESRQSSWKLL